MSRTRKGYRNVFRAASEVLKSSVHFKTHMVETLEMRTMLAAVPWTISGNSGADDISISMENYMGNTYIRKDDYGSYTERRLLTDVSELIINGGAGDDTINIDSLDTVQVSINGQADDDTITLGAVESLGSIAIRGNDGEDTITLEDVHDVSNIVIAGGNGEDTFNLISAKFIAHTIEVFGHEGVRDTNDGTGEEDGGVVDHLNVGGGNLDDFGDVFFDDGDKFPADPYTEAASDPISIDDSNTTFDTSWTVEDSGLITRTRSGAGTFNLQISVFTVSNPLVVNAGSGNDSIISSGDMDSVEYRYLAMGNTLNGNDGADTIIAGQGTGEFEINGGDGNDLLDVEGADFYSVDWPGPFPVEPQVPFGTLNGGAGDDHIYVSHISKIGAHLGLLIINGDDGFDTIEVDNSNLNDGNDATYELTPEVLYIAWINSANPSYTGSLGAELDTYEQFNLRMQNFDSGTAGTPSFTYNYNPTGGVVDPTPVTVYPSSINVSGTYLATDVFVRRTDPGNPVTIMPSYGKTNVTVGDSIYSSNQADVIFGAQELGGPLPSIGALEISSIGTVSLDVGAGKALKMTSLTIDYGGLFDITNGAAIISNSTANNTSLIDDIQALVVDGRGTATYPDGLCDGEWDGTTGIGSSVARSDFINDTYESHIVAYAENDLLPLGAHSTFGGQSVGTNDMLLMYTVNGDATLDGWCGDNDATVLAIFYDAGVTSGHRLFEADWNYDGLVNDTDNSILAICYQGPE